jgi:polyisoprenoid-binding protein YceI
LIALGTGCIVARMAEPTGERANVFGPDAASCEVFTFREGMLSAVAHDLRLRVGSFEIAVDPAGSAVSARFDPASLRVESAMRDGRPLPGALRPADAREIEATIAATVLRAARFPELRFASSEVVRRQDGGYDVRGTLTLAGASRPLAFPVRREGERLVAEVTLHQPSFGIRPYSAMLGTLRVKPDVLVRVALPAGGL